ncbi:MAG: HIT domain-containing protein [Bacilli bacterium]|nr:HIT domain-containing protein [Bacilli bacterium]
MNDCLFCKIIKKELPSKTIYEDQLIQVIMNINPLTNGHLLVLPKKHFTNILDIDEEFINHSFKIIKKELYPILKEKLNCKGLTIIENNELGQEIRHFHIHLIPRYENDEYKEISSKDIKNLDEIFSKITK